MTKSNTDLVKFWRESADRAYTTARGLYRLRRYDACLFFCHLTLEKLLKGLVVQNTNAPSPYLHDLARLAELASLKITDTQRQQLRTITTFNIAARYDDIKLAFYKKCTPVFTKHHLQIVQELYLWLKENYR